MGKSLIRLITNTTPFSRAEVDILSYIYKVLNGELPQSGLSSLIKSNIKGTYSLNKSELMYFYALYKMNYLESGDFSSIQNVEVPKMYDYNVNFLQDVSAWRSIDHNVIAADDFDAHEAMDYDFDYNTEEVSSYVDDQLEVGDGQDIFDTEVTHNIHEPINETRVIIKNILKEYKK
tara:strand:- start:140 stop:667 length:528 start_codon:yes stop_codon:yes gene_type:complete